MEEARFCGRADVRAWLEKTVCPPSSVEKRTVQNIIMKTKTNLLAAGILLATTVAVLSQPTITSLRLSGQAATIYDASHLYASNSVSPGANVTFTVTASGTPPLHYQW